MRLQLIYYSMAILSIGAVAFSRIDTTPLQLRYPSYFGNRIFIPADNPTTVEGVALGRMLFYDPRLSANNKLSCSSCHQQSKAFTDGEKTSIGINGMRSERNSMSLANLLWVRSLFWDGRADGLEKQAAFPITHPHEMGNTMEASASELQQSTEYPALFQKAFGSSTINTDNIAKALAQFERTLISARSTYDRYLRGEYQPTESELNGIILFYTNPSPARNIRGAGCGQCHGGPKTFNNLFHNNGLDSLSPDAGRESITGQEIDRGRFRVVTLRNIALTAPYMHDGRFNNLEEVLDHYNEHIPESPTVSRFLIDNTNNTSSKALGLTADEKKDIISFLHLLTDSSFVTDKRFSNPFSKK